MIIQKVILRFFYVLQDTKWKNPEQKVVNIDNALANTHTQGRTTALADK